MGSGSTQHGESCGCGSVSCPSLRRYIGGAEGEGEEEGMGRDEAGRSGVCRG